MRLLSGVALVSSFAAVSLTLLAPIASASPAEEVLGTSTNISEINFPGLAAGPGFILPDSPLYPLDQLVQELRFVLAFVPEQRAEVDMRIGGERLAEARVMMKNGDHQGVEVALAGFEKAITGAANELANAGAKGRVTSEQAKTINQELADYRAVLQEVASQAPASLAYRLDATGQTVLEAKVRVEEELPGDEMAMAIENDLQNEVDRQVLGVQTSAYNIMQRTNALENHSSISAEQRMKYEEMMASKSGVRKDLLEQRKKALQEYQDQKKKLQQERQKLYDQIKSLMLQLQGNQRAMQQLQQMQNSLNNGSPTATVTPSSQ